MLTCYLGYILFKVELHLLFIILISLKKKAQEAK